MTDTDVVAAPPGTVPRSEEILTPGALRFLTDLHRRFNGERLQRLADRARRAAELAAGGTLGFLPETAAIRDDPSWRVAEPAVGLVDRRVEITGPTERKMTINALNSGARVWLADFEDANAPQWTNMVEGQLNLRDAILRRIDFTSPEGKAYALHENPATIVVRPRGWHLPEKHLGFDGEEMSGSLVDFGLYAYHCAALQLERGSGPYFYLPKMESHLEARLWNAVFAYAESELGLPEDCIRATVLIETIPAAFEMEEILYELRTRSAGLNAGRWDYLFSVIKKFHARSDMPVLPDRSTLTMTMPFMRAYTDLLVSTCHGRGAHAIGGMAAMIPNRRDPEANEIALAGVRNDKLREAGDGFDGSWVAHPDLVPICEAAFTETLGLRSNQIERLREDVAVGAHDLLDFGSAGQQRSKAGLVRDVAVALRYLAAWLGGNGAVAIFGLMEDAATAEISRSLIRQWIDHEVVLDTGETVTTELVRSIAAAQIDDVRDELGAAFEPATWRAASDLFDLATFADPYPEFLTLPGYDVID